MIIVLHKFFRNENFYHIRQLIPHHFRQRKCVTLEIIVSTVFFIKSSQIPIIFQGGLSDLFNRFKELLFLSVQLFNLLLRSLFPVVVTCVFKYFSCLVTVLFLFCHIPSIHSLACANYHILPAKNVRRINVTSLPSCNKTFFSISSNLSPSAKNAIMPSSKHCHAFSTAFFSSTFFRL